MLGNILVPLLSPNFIDIEQAQLISETLRSEPALREKLPEPGQVSELINILNNNGASVEAASKTIAQVMHEGKYDHNRLRAAELVLDLHGVRNKDGDLIKQPIFQFFIKDSDVNVNDIFSPVRSGQ